MVSEKFIMTKLQLLTSKGKQFNALYFFSEATSLSYKTPQEDNDRMSKIIESIIRTAKVSVLFTHAEDTKITNNPHINGSIYLQQSSQA